MCLNDSVCLCYCNTIFLKIKKKELQIMVGEDASVIRCHPTIGRQEKNWNVCVGHGWELEDGV